MKKCTKQSQDIKMACIVHSSLSQRKKTQSLCDIFKQCNSMYIFSDITHTEFNGICSCMYKITAQVPYFSTPGVCMQVKMHSTQIIWVSWIQYYYSCIKVPPKDVLHEWNFSQFGHQFNSKDLSVSKITTHECSPNSHNIGGCSCKNIPLALIFSHIK